MTPTVLSLATDDDPDFVSGHRLLEDELLLGIESARPGLGDQGGDTPQCHVRTEPVVIVEGCPILEAHRHLDHDPFDGLLMLLGRDIDAPFHGRRLRDVDEQLVFAEEYRLEEGDAHLMRNQLSITDLALKCDQSLRHSVHAVGDQPTEQRMRSIRIHMHVVPVTRHLGCQEGAGPLHGSAQVVPGSRRLFDGPHELREAGVLVRMEQKIRTVAEVRARRPEPLHEGTGDVMQGALVLIEEPEWQERQLELGHRR